MDDGWISTALIIYWFKDIVPVYSCQISAVSYLFAVACGWGNCRRRELCCARVYMSCFVFHILNHEYSCFFGAKMDTILVFTAWTLQSRRHSVCAADVAVLRLRLPVIVCSVSVWQNASLAWCLQWNCSISHTNYFEWSKWDVKLFVLLVTCIITLILCQTLGWVWPPEENFSIISRRWEYFC